MLFRILLLSVAFFTVGGGVTRADGPASKNDVTVAQMRKVIEKALPFLEKEGLAWLQNRKCIACHHGAFMVWSHSEAQQRGFAVDAKKIAVWTFQVLDKNLSDHKEMLKNKNGCVESTNVVLSQSLLSSGDGENAKKVKAAAGIIVAAQQADGFWKYEGQGQKRPPEEANESTTLWAILALTGAEKLDPAFIKSRDRALAWLKKQKQGEGNEPAALRLVVETRFGDKAKAKELAAQLLSRQNADGSWSWGKGWPSDPYATGQTLYALDVAGVKEPQAIAKAWKFLRDKQRPDGSWFSPTKKPTAKDNPIAVYWGSAWATIGLLRSLPDPLPKVDQHKTN